MGLSVICGDTFKVSKKSVTSYLNAFVAKKSRLLQQSEARHFWDTRLENLTTFLATFSKARPFVWENSFCSLKNCLAFFLKAP